MAKTIMVASAPQWMTVTDNTTRYFVIANAPLIADSSEGNTQITHRSLGKMSNLYIIVADNTLPDDGVSGSTLRTRKNGANGNQSIFIPHSSIGEFEDTTNTDTIAAGDEFNGSITLPSVVGARTISLHVCSIVFNAANINTVVRHAATNFADMSDGNSYTFALSDNGGVLNTLFANVDFNLNAAGFIRNLFVKVSSNGNVSAGTNTVVTIYKNQIATNLKINIPASETIQTVFENTVDHVSVSADDEIELVIDSVNSGAVVIEIISVEWASTNFKFHSVFGYSGGGIIKNIGSQDYLPIGGGGVGFVLEPESNHKTEMQFSCIVSNLACYVTSNTLDSSPGAGSGTFIYVRKNGSSTSIVVHIEEGITGFFEDASNSAEFVASDEVNLFCTTTGLAGNITFGHIGCMLTNNEVKETVSIKGANIKGATIL